MIGPHKAAVRLTFLALLLAASCLLASHAPAAGAAVSPVGIALGPLVAPVDGNACLNILGAAVCLGSGSSSSGGSVAASGSPACPNWAGTWATTFGTTTLSVSGNAATGTYTDNGGRLTGTVSGSTLRGTWSEQPSYTAPNDAGDFQFTLSADGTSFNGQWRYGSSGDWSPWSGSCTSAGAVTAALGAASGAATSTGSGSSGSGSQSAGCKRSRLVVLQGLATDSTYGIPYFADIVNAAGSKYSGVTYFSYSLNDPQNYSQQDSLQAISTSVQALHQTVAREIAACDGVTIDLIGHSNGGVVALRYLAAYGPSTSEGSHIRHLITLDSPVNGISSSLISSLVQSASLFGLDLSYLQNTPAIKDLIAAYNDSGTPQRNINLAKSLSGKVTVLTMGSDDDLVVPFSSASIPGFSSEWALGVVSSLCPTYADACVGHNQILHDPGVLAKIAGVLGTSP